MTRAADGNARPVGMYRRILRACAVGAMILSTTRAAAQVSVPGAPALVTATPLPSVAAAAHVVVAAKPKEFTIARVAVPAEIPADLPVSYTVRVLGTAAVISQLRGTLAPAAERKVLLTFGISAHSAAGHAPVAEITFETPTGQRAIVQVDVEVSVMRALSLELIQQTVGSKPGGRIALRYRITNQGNTSDTIKVRYELPAEWTATESDSRIMVIDHGSMQQRQATVRVPNSAGAGNFSVIVHAENAAGTAKTVERLYVDVPATHSAPTSRAVSLNTSISSTSGSAGGGSALMGLSFAGPVFRDIEVGVDVTSAPALSEKGRYRLSSLGQFPQPPNYTLSRGPGRLRLGGVGASFSELTGMGAGGRGVSLGYESARLSIKSAFAGKGLGFGSTIPDSTQSESPQVAGVRISSKVSPNMWVTGTLAHLNEGKVELGRQLDVGGVGLLIPSLFGGALESEVAYRKFADGSGVGLFSEFTRTTALDRVQLRGVFAPGGNLAYAGANGTLSGYASHAINKQWQLGGQGFFTENAGSSGESARSFGAGILPQYQVRKGLSLGLDLGGSLQTLQSRGSNFDNKDQHLSANINYSLNQKTALSVASTAARVTRGLAIDSIPSGNDQLTSGRQSILAAISRGTVHFGTLLFTAQASKDGSNSIGLPRQHQLALRLDRFPLFFPGGYSLYATGIVQQLGWFGDRPSVTTLRGDLTADLPLNLALTFSVDRNPLVSVAGSGPWSTSLRLGRTTFLTVPAFLRGRSRSGVVFEDLNGNGVQDPGESGMSGVIVKRGEQYVTTEEDGTFKLPSVEGTHTERLRIDARTIPLGWMEKNSPLSEDEARLVKAIAIIPTSAVRLHLVVRRDDLGAAGSIDLTRIVVIAKDSLNRAYLAQPLDSTTQSFSAIPPGNYQVTVDPSSAGAQLQVAEAPTNFKVGADRAGHDFEIVLSTRTVKLKTFGPRTEEKVAATPAKPTAKVPAGMLPRRSTGAAADTVVVDPRNLPPRKPQ